MHTFLELDSLQDVFLRRFGIVHREIDGRDGVGVNEIVTDFGKSVYVIVDNDVPTGTILLADLAYVKPVFTRDVETGEVISVKAAPQRNGNAVNIYAEFGLDYGAEFNHGKLTYSVSASGEESTTEETSTPGA